MPAGRSLIFVYDIDNEALPDINDHMSRMAGPASVRCKLHALTYSPIGMKKEWKRVVQGIGIPARFLARDVFGAEFPNVTAAFPSVFLQAGKDLYQFISPEEINHCEALEDLILLVEQRLAASRV